MANIPNLDDIPGRAADFARSLMDLADYVEGNFEKVLRKACVDLYRKVVERTPVDTGRAKASWGISTSGEQRPQPKDIELSFNEVKTIIDEHVRGFILDIHDNKIIISNNVEYIEFLESGDSKQAPRGMVAVSLVEFTAHFNKALQGIEGLSPT